MHGSCRSSRNRRPGQRRGGRREQPRGRHHTRRDDGGFFALAGHDLTKAFKLPCGSKILRILAVILAVVGLVLATGPAALGAAGSCARAAVRGQQVQAGRRKPGQAGLLFGGSALVTCLHLALAASILAFGAGPGLVVRRRRVPGERGAGGGHSRHPAASGRSSRPSSRGWGAWACRPVPPSRPCCSTDSRRTGCRSCPGLAVVALPPAAGIPVTAGAARPQRAAGASDRVRRCSAVRPAGRPPLPHHIERSGFIWLRIAVVALGAAVAIFALRSGGRLRLGQGPPR